MDFMKDTTRRLNAVCFIEAAQELIDTEGPDQVSVRKIAAKAGFHNSTIYLYFKDVDQLVMLASLKYFEQYSKALARQSLKNVSYPENFLAIWSFFGETVFAQPQIFYNFFFGKHSEDLTDVIKLYYELFPEEKEEYSTEIESMFYGRNITERCLRLLEPMTKEKTSVTEDNLELVNDIIVNCLKGLLEQKLQNPQMDEKALNERLLDMIVYTVGMYTR